MKMGDAKAAAPEVQGQPGGDETFEMQQLRAMEQPSWSEGRLDDLNRRVDNGIGRLDDERKELRAEMKAGFERVDQRFEKVDEEFKAVRSEMKAGFERMDAKFDRLTWSLLGAALAIVVALIGAPQL
jgi:tetrahydromethanopterin S-methyltransferase subunit G